MVTADLFRPAKESNAAIKRPKLDSAAGSFRSGLGGTGGACNRRCGLVLTTTTPRLIVAGVICERAGKRQGDALGPWVRTKVSGELSLLYNNR